MVLDTKFVMYIIIALFVLGIGGYTIYIFVSRRKALEAKKDLEKKLKEKEAQLLKERKIAEVKNRTDIAKEVVDTEIEKIEEDYNEIVEKIKKEDVVLEGKNGRIKISGF